MDSPFIPPLPRIEPPFVYAFEAMSKEVARFQNRLPADQEIGITVSGADNVIHVSAIRRSGQMVVFEGLDNQGRKAQLIQHYTQVNVQVIAVDALHETANRIGF
jgi:hypothetical protein